MGVNLLVAKQRRENENSSDSGSATSASVSCNLQTQILAMFLDKLSKAKTVDKFEKMLSLPAPQIFIVAMQMQNFHIAASHSCPSLILVFFTFSFMVFQVPSCDFRFEQVDSAVDPKG